MGCLHISSTAWRQCPFFKPETGAGQLVWGDAGGSMSLCELCLRAKPGTAACESSFTSHPRAHKPAASIRPGLPAREARHTAVGTPGIGPQIWFTYLGSSSRSQGGWARKRSWLNSRRVGVWPSRQRRSQIRSRVMGAPRRGRSTGKGRGKKERFPLLLIGQTRSSKGLVLKLTQRP